MTGLSAVSVHSDSHTYWIWNRAWPGEGNKKESHSLTAFLSFRMNPSQVLATGGRMCHQTQNEGLWETLTKITPLQVLASDPTQTQTLECPNGRAH